MISFNNVISFDTFNNLTTVLCYNKVLKLIHFKVYVGYIYGIRFLPNLRALASLFFGSTNIAEAPAGV